MNKIKPHNHAVIGIKKLSEADLGSSIKSNQTHIGLFESTLITIDDIHLINLCFLFTENMSKKLLCLLDYIENPDGTFRSPKIRKGAKEELFFENKEMNSVVREIRSISKKIDQNKDWYILWFATDNHELVFVLFEFRSNLFDALSLKLDGIKVRQQLKNTDNAFHNILNELSSFFPTTF